MTLRKTRKPRTPPPTRHRIPRLATVVLFTLAAACGVVLVIGWLGDLARQHLGPRDRYRVQFSEIECEPPPGMDRATFLSEVRYVSNFPPSFQLLDPELELRLSSAFAAHPWVESVEGADVSPPGRARLRLRFRTPVLAAQVHSGGVRLVDGNGVLLPVTDHAPELPELTTVVHDPETAAGKVWANAAVLRAIELVKTYHPRRIEKTPGGWKLTGTDGKVLSVSG